VSITRRSKFAALALGLALVGTACSSDSKKVSSTSTKDTTAPAASTASSVASTDTTTGATDTTVAVTDTTTGATDTTMAGASGGTATYAAEQEYTAYNNATADQVLFANTLVLNIVQPGPYISNPDLTLTPFKDMMDSIEVTSTDPQVVVYKIKPAAVWSDGAPIDCSDFYLAWLAQNGKAGNQKAADGTDAKDADGNPIPIFNAAGTTGYEDIGTVACSDNDKTVTTTYTKAFADYQSLFGGLIPAHVVEKDTGVADVTKATDPADVAKIGADWSTGFSGFDPAKDLSGAQYTIDSFTPGETLILKRNEKYYGTPGKLDEIVFRQVPDASQQPAALENGDVQVISPQPNPDLLAQLKAISGVTTEVDQGVTFEHYDFNQANEFLADPNVRKAFALCINRQDIVDTLVAPLNPDATVLNNRIYIPSSPDYKDNSGAYAKQDIAGAKKLLESSGFTMGSDGFYAKGGKQLTLRLGRRDPNPRRQSTNELTAAACKDAGFNLTDDPSEDFNAKRLPASDYDIALFAWVATASLSSNTSIYVPGGGQNWNNYKDDKLTPLFEQANKELDAKKRADLMNQIDKVLWDDMATLPLFQFQELISYSDTIQNVSYNGPLGVTWDAQNWAVAS
jgi:peptide/nickel transport system substrate-binding protein